jgi:Tol biopolymer transport system component
VDGTPAATPDGSYIVFMSNRTGAFQVWRMNLDGSNQIQLTEGAGKNHPAISPDGRWVLYNTSDDWHLWKVSIDGGEPSRLTEYYAASPSVSPDGKMIACVGRTESKRELLILPFDGGATLKRLDFDGWSSRLHWTADGKALIHEVDRNGSTAIIRRPLDGGLPREIVTFDEDALFDFGYSYDGQKLAVTRGGMAIRFCINQRSVCRAVSRGKLDKILKSAGVRACINLSTTTSSGSKSQDISRHRGLNPAAALL